MYAIENIQFLNRNTSKSYPIKILYIYIFILSVKILVRIEYSLEISLEIKCNESKETT